MFERGIGLFEICFVTTIGAKNFKAEAAILLVLLSLPASNILSASHLFASITNHLIPTHLKA